ncbi:MAG TPA: hypothetical protein ENN28_01955 [Candidatus Uhrbacteria bacterium]|nr:hypothetical protein [Candidatus Uhrbacteria bacterium]
MQKKKSLFLAGILLLLAVMIFSLPQLSESASTLTISPESAPVDTDTEYCIGAYTLATPAGSTFEVEFASGFDLTDLTISDTEADSELVLHLGTLTCSGGTARITEATATPDNDRDFAEVDGQIIRVVLEDAIESFSPLSFQFRTQDGTSVVTPETPGNYDTYFRLYDDEGNLTGQQVDFLYVGDANVVEISGSVDPSLSFSLNRNTCALGTLSSSIIKTCHYSSTVSTNASSGYTSYIVADGDLRDGDDSITNVSGDSEVAAGTESYGVSTTKDAYDIRQIQDANSDTEYTSADCETLNEGTTAANATELTTSDQTYGGSSGPVDSEVVSLCHAASISGTTPAGIYSQTITITVVGNF